MFLTSVFRPGINVAATPWFWCRLPGENVNVFQYPYNSFSKDMQYCLAIPFFDKQNLFCMCQSKAFAQMVVIWKFAACCLKREKRFLIFWRKVSIFCLDFSVTKFWSNLICLGKQKKMGKQNQPSKRKEYAMQSW